MDNGVGLLLSSALRRYTTPPFPHKLPLPYFPAPPSPPPPPLSFPPFYPLPPLPLSIHIHRFPLDLTSVLNFLEPLAMDGVSARSVFQCLCRVQHYTDDFTQVPAHSVDVGNEAGSWIITKPLPLYLRGKLCCQFLITVCKLNYCTNTTVLVVQ